MGQLNQSERRTSVTGKESLPVGLGITIANPLAEPFTPREICRDVTTPNFQALYPSRWNGCFFGKPAKGNRTSLEVHHAE